MKKFLSFIILRSPVYILSVLSYYNNGKITFLECIQKKYSIKYFPYILLIFLIILLFMIVKWFKKKILEGQKITKKFLVIQKSDTDIEFNFISSYIIPLIAGFQDVKIIILIGYEFFIYLIFLKNTDKYYTLLVSLIYTEYVGKDFETGEEITFFSSEKEDTIKKYMTYGIGNKEMKLNNVSFSNDDPLTKNILIFKEEK